MDRNAVAAAFASLEAHRVEIASRRAIDLFDADPRPFRAFFRAA